MCCPGLFECLHLWSAARCCHECAVDSDERNHQSTVKPYKEWIRRYTNEEHRGFMFLQRERRLKELQSGEVSPPRSEPLDTPPEYAETSPSLERQIAETRQQYWLHQQKLAEIETEKPRGRLIKQWEMLRRLKNGQGKSIAWEEGRRTCAVLGGCCGRNCGCCDKPQKEFLMPIGNRKEKSEIFGHCTVECPCCIRFRGFYKPDLENVRLPELGQSASHLPRPTDNGSCLGP